jgi:hypothetical protein
MNSSFFHCSTTRLSDFCYEFCTRTSVTARRALSSQMSTSAFSATSITPDLEPQMLEGMGMKLLGFEGFPGHFLPRRGRLI